MFSALSRAPRAKRLSRVCFDQCDLRELDLTEAAALEHVRFSRCDLSGARITGARRIVALDLRGSKIDNLAIDLAALPALIVDPAQAMEIAALVGVTIKEEGMGQ